MIKTVASDNKEYGVKRHGDGFCFTVSFCMKDSLKVAFYTLKGESLAEIDISEYNLSGNVYSFVVKGLPIEGFQYEYILDGKSVKDPYMKRHSLKRKFGVENTNASDRAVFKNDEYDFEGDKHLKLDYSDVCMYQLHVRGFTNHQSSKVKGKGCFLGITEKIPYLSDLGISQIELMPAYDFYEFDSKIDELPLNHPSYITDTTLDENGLVTPNKPKVKINYWGYKTANYFCPKNEYAYTDDSVKEFKDMVKALHKAGIEVIMQMYFDKMQSSAFIIDVMRFWYLEYHVDGFHLLGERIPFDSILTDELLADAKLYFNNIDKDNEYFRHYSDLRNITDVNNSFKISSLRFLKSDLDSLGSFVFFNRNNPADIHALNYLTCYEGFTLNDAVSYDFKHNEDNGENNTDGINENFSWNCGIEGKSSKKSVKELRIRQVKNALCMLLLSQGTPMLFMGDELLNSQNGNNNPYCQDNDTTWLNWKLNKTNQEIYDFTKKLIRYRKQHVILHQKNALKNMDYLAVGSPDISYHQDMAWKSNLSNYMLHIGMMLDGNYAKTSLGTVDDTIYIAYNMHWENHILGLPKLKKGMKWIVDFSTANDGEIEDIIKDLFESQDTICVYKRSVLVLKAVKG